MGSHPRPSGEPNAGVERKGKDPRRRLLCRALGEARARTHRVQTTLIFVIPVDVQRVLACLAEDERGMRITRLEFGLRIHAATVSHVGEPNIR
jgi:hypothetical protein